MYKKSVIEIEKLVENYFKGIFYGDTLKLENCFYKNVDIYGDIKGDEYSKSVKEYLEGVKNRQSPKEQGETLKMSIIGIDVIGKIASAKLHLPMLGYNYYDYLSLAKINNEWKIVNKLFTHVE
ncbi:nuclear transport factor 2 family protein [Aquimarina sp. 2201CG5-10]|uniref:nuclear transport factor 2 family protein n=1 Tax=Aquimarina callyspongiae TaxID=3098150 RepID=UPI002AB3AA3C|nr:nuclear transport factor 2 family protein [Aquimarina sp. 2201CG5-10]MDY8136256.1 nuclear transport factor 2 family protein [Aquimarina sp. 2201CG5-10]